MPKWDINRLSTSELSALKRNAGTMMENASIQALEAFYRAITDRCGTHTEKAWFAALCMQCLWRIEDHAMIKPFPEILSTMYHHPDATDSMRKRCTSFLDYTWDDDGYLLGKICSLARKMRVDNPNIMPNFDTLADDLARWNSGDHWVQRKWLTIICNNQNEHEKQEGQENAD